MDFFQSNVEGGTDLKQNTSVKLEKLSPEKRIITKSHNLLLSKI